VCACMALLMGLCCVGTTGFIVSRKTFALPEVLILYPTTINTHVPLLTTNIYLWVLSQNCGPLGCNAAFRSLLSMQISGD
jgi:hypothetical protein